MSDSVEAAEPVFQFDSLMQPEVSKCPWPYYKQMRDTNPVLRAGGEGSEVVFIAKHEDIDHVLHNPRLFSSAGDLTGQGGHVSLIPIAFDPRSTPSGAGFLTRSSAPGRWPSSKTA